MLQVNYLCKYVAATQAMSQLYIHVERSNS